MTAALVGEGASVVAARSHTDNLTRLADQGKVHPVEVDLGPMHLIEEAVKAYGAPGILVDKDEKFILTSTS